MTFPRGVWFSSIAEMAELYRHREIAPVEVTHGLLERIEQLDPLLHAFITVCADRALREAEVAECRLRRGDDGPLVGIPIAVKDSIATERVATTGNSRVLANWTPNRDATVVAKLRDAGAVILGKTNLNEFEWSIPSEGDLCPPPRNPWNSDYAAMGSSSGSGVAVAAGLAIAALGTDSGGSVRLPAGQMGLVGFKATHALVSRSGGLHHGSIVDFGALARTVADAASLLTVMAGYDPTDLDSQPTPHIDYRERLGTGIEGLRVGVPRDYIAKVPVEDEIQLAFEGALRVLARLGAKIIIIDLPVLEYARGANFVTLNGEYYTAHEGLLVRQWATYGQSARLYLAQGAFLSATDFVRAYQVGRLARAAADAAFREVEILAMPTSPFVTTEAARSPKAHLAGIGASFTSPFNIMGHPAVSVPCGMSAARLPIGLQLVGQRYEESLVFQVAHAYEQATDWHALTAPVG